MTPEKLRSSADLLACATGGEGIRTRALRAEADRMVTARVAAHQRARILRDAGSRIAARTARDVRQQYQQGGLAFAAANRQEAIGNGQSTGTVPWFWDRHDTVDAIFASQVDFS